jgi:gamma-glutamyltranspeptidase/glutathione hydrolase
MFKKIFVTLSILTISSTQVFAQETSFPDYEAVDGFVPIIGSRGMVSSRRKIATQVGADILEQGGNAIDAAAAVAFALAVVHPEAGNIGGGGFMVLHTANDKRTTTIDYREYAANRATHDIYVVDDKVDHFLSFQSRKSTGVPGTVAGMAVAVQKYGTMSLSSVIKPAYELAKNGFKVGRHLERTFETHKEKLTAAPETRATFFKEDGGNYRYGDTLIQPDLAHSLKLIMDEGVDAFYKGEIARKIVADQEKYGGIITMKDMADYEPVEREPIRGTYKGYEIAAMPPPSSGGVHLVQMLNMLENDDIKSLGHNSAATLHLYIEAMRQAYADRSLYTGDPAFFDVPVDKLTDKAYALEMRARIPMDHARKSSEVAPTKGLQSESPQTTHFSVMDKWGNAVSNTYTVNYGFYEGMMAGGTGIVLNNEMDDFDHLPYEPDVNGNISGKANAQEPRKRPRSSMTPTIVLKDGVPFLLTGSPGSSTIINTVFQTIMNVIEFDMNIAAASSKPRIHHQWMPDIVEVESSLNMDTMKILKNMGHNLVYRADSNTYGFKTLGETASIVYKDGFFYGAHDPRNMDAGTIGLE